MPNIAPEKLNTFTANVLRAAGATENEIEIVGPHLVDACLAGQDSHGVLRLRQYVQEIRDGVICNEKVLSFQRRSPDYPHEPR